MYYLQRQEGNSNDWARLLSCYLPPQSPWSVTVTMEITQLYLI